MAPRRQVATIIAVGAAALLATPMAFAKTPGTTYCYREICHRVQTISETAKDIGKPAHVLASYYDVPWRDKFNPSLTTSSGAAFRPLDADSAASPIYPDGTRLLVFAPRSGGAAVVRVNNTGPYWSGRALDVSRGVAEQLGFFGQGLAHVLTVVLTAPTPAEARFEEGRAYSPVLGYLGRFTSFRQALATWAGHPQAMLLAAIPPTTGEPDMPAPARVVIIKERGEARSGAEAKTEVARPSRIVLKPVKSRRPRLLAAVGKRKTRVADAAKGRKAP